MFALEAALFELGRTAHVLDGESLRSGISEDLGFAPEDRWQHQRRAAEIARLTNDLGLVTIAALVSPSQADRDAAARIIGPERFFLVHCSAPIEVCEARDTAGLYERARRGEVKNLTGVDAPYEEPSNADLVLDTAEIDVETNLARLLEALEERGLI